MLFTAAQSTATTRMKIKLILCIFETFTKNEGTKSDYIRATKVFGIIRSHFLLQSVDYGLRGWYLNICGLFPLSRSNRDHHAPAEDWLFAQLKKLNIICIDEAHEQDILCLEYAYKQIGLDIAEVPINNSLPIRVRASLFRSIYCNTAPLSDSELEPGDIVLYTKDDAITHIAIYLTTVDRKPYFVSKFGTNKPCYHPVDATPTNYGEPSYYRLKDEEKTETLTSQLTAHKRQLVMAKLAMRAQTDEYATVGEPDSKKAPAMLRAS